MHGRLYSCKKMCPAIRYSCKKMCPASPAYLGGLVQIRRMQRLSADWLLCASVSCHEAG